MVQLILELSKFDLRVILSTDFLVKKKYFTLVLNGFVDGVAESLFLAACHGGGIPSNIIIV
jgi:hypothetical protein